MRTVLKQWSKTKRRRNELASQRKSSKEEKGSKGEGNSEVYYRIRWCYLSVVKKNEFTMLTEKYPKGVENYLDTTLRTAVKRDQKSGNLVCLLALC